jgi:RND family efflux transporter MFP subunit
VPAATVAPTPIDVDVERVEAKPIVRRIPIVGTLHAAEEAVISTRAAGILRRTFVDVGDEVTPGTPLVQVDTLDYEAAVRQARAALGGVLARLGVADVPDEAFDLKQVSTVERAAAHLENARFSYQRLARLNESGLSNVAEQELNDAATQLRMAEADHQLAIDEAAALAANARERQAQLQIAEQRLSHTKTVTPPIPTTLGTAGAQRWMVAERLVTEGQYLEAAAPLYRLIIRNPLKLRCRVPERYGADARHGQWVELDVLGGAASPKGRVTRMSPNIDPASRTFEVEALIDNDPPLLKPGAFARGAVIAEGREPKILIPARALVTGGGAARVFVVEGGVAHEREVRLGLNDDGRAEVVSGLHAGELLVTAGAGTISNASPVRVRPRDAQEPTQ